MLTISIDKAMGVYGELVEAYHGLNGYGGHTAEIYCYRLTDIPVSYKYPNERSDSSIWYQDWVDCDFEAATNLKLMIFKIKKTYLLDFADIEIDGVDSCTWINSIIRNEGISHRVHVKIERKIK
jgi:hypothetical protein